MNWTAILGGVWDVALTVVVAMIPFVLPLVVARVAALLKISEDSERYQSLYRTIDYLSRAALARRAPTSAAVLSGVPADVVDDVLEGLKDLNAENVLALGQNDAALKAKIAGRLPEAQAAVAQAQVAAVAAAEVKAEAA